MSITDELRDWFKARMCMANGWQEIRDIADRIDAEHERAVRYERCAFWHDASDDELANYGLLRAPIDADGVPWCLDDRDEYGGTVTAIKLAVDGFWINAGCIYRQAHEARHYHAPTVEDVLREFTDAILDWAGKSGTVAETGTWSDVAAKYATKLRLADDGEEQ